MFSCSERIAAKIPEYRSNKAEGSMFGSVDCRSLLLPHNAGHMAFIVAPLFS
jgi:hypothetical protein